MSQQDVVTEAILRDRLAFVREKMVEALEKSGRGPDDTKLLVASKYYDAAQISILAEVGARLLGENRAEDLALKQQEFGDVFEWHFIGHLQRRKAREVVSRVSLIHSVDSVRLIREIENRVDENGMDILIQVNVSEEESKYGIRESEVEALLEATAATGGKVHARGFMTIAPLVEDPEDVRYVFAKLRAIRDRLAGEWRDYFDLSELSMGMSKDYAVAVEEGATIVRIGRTLIEKSGS